VGIGPPQQLIAAVVVGQDRVGQASHGQVEGLILEWCRRRVEEDERRTACGCCLISSWASRQRRASARGPPQGRRRRSANPPAAERRTDRTPGGRDRRAVQDTLEDRPETAPRQRSVGDVHLHVLPAVVVAADGPADGAGHLVGLVGGRDPHDTGAALLAPGALPQPGIHTCRVTKPPRGRRILPASRARSCRQPHVPPANATARRRSTATPAAPAVVRRDARGRPATAPGAGSSSTAATSPPPGSGFNAGAGHAS